jgi:hypothetical protein
MRTIEDKRFTMACGLVFVVASAVGCGMTTPDVNPAPRSDAGWAGDSALGDSALGDSAEDGVSPPDAAPDAGPIVREVFTRDPFGRLDPANMMHDGDFEHSAPDSMQYPWLGIEYSRIVTGPACRSGLRCVEISPEDYLYGMFVWPDAPAVEVSFYGKPETSQDCEKEGVGLVMMADTYGKETRIGAETSEPVDGWCRYAAVMPVPSNIGYHWWVLVLATRGEATGPVVFDDVSMVVASKTVGTQRGLTTMLLEERAMVTRAREAVKKMMPPNPVREPLPVKNPTGRRK